MVEAIVPRDWRMLYTAAMLESDSAQLQAGIAKAHAAMTARLMELPHGRSSSMERRELVSALKYLSCLEASLASE